MLGWCIPRTPGHWLRNSRKVQNILLAPHLPSAFWNLSHNFFSIEQLEKHPCSSGTPVLQRCCSTLISLRSLSTEDGRDAHRKGDLAGWLAGGSQRDYVSKRQEQRVEQQRRRNIELQELKMNRIILRGLKETLNEDELKAEVMNLFQAIGVQADHMIIHSVFRTQQGNVLCELSEKKWVDIIRACTMKNIRNTQYSRVNVSVSLCNPFLKIDYELRTLKREGKIENCRIYSGRPNVLLLGSDEWEEITHIQDLVKLGLLDSA